MTPTECRDQVADLAKTDVRKAEEMATKITDPWFEAQAWSHMIRWSDEPKIFVRRAVLAASKTKDSYQRSAVRAWEIAALGERGYAEQARQSLLDAIEISRSIEHSGSRAEAMMLLFQSAFKVSLEDARSVAEILISSCSSEHWREKRARKWVSQMLSNEIQPRDFFW